MYQQRINKKLIIGSANFLNKYGINKNNINSIEINKIISLADKNRIFKIDTAEGYVKNKNIFKKINKKFKFTTKVIPNNDWVSLNFCEKSLNKHFSKFNNNKIDTLFFHDINFFFNKNGIKIYKNIETLKNKNLFKKIGLSIYETDCLDYILERYNIDAIQCPYNILDKRIITSGWLSKLKKKGIEVHARSIFLQGLLTNRSICTKKYFKKWKKKIQEWFVWLEKNKISSIDYCLSDLIDKNFDYIVIGIDNCANLEEILKFKKIVRNKVINMETNDLRLIDPRKWK